MTNPAPPAEPSSAAALRAVAIMEAVARSERPLALSEKPPVRPPAMRSARKKVVAVTAMRTVLMASAWP